MFFTFNPYAPTDDWKGDNAFQASGTGLLLHRRGVDASGSLFAAHLASRRGRNVVDHFVRYFNDFELWRKGEWVITHPRGYGGPPNTGLGTNAVLMQGFGDMLGFKELLGVSSSETHDFQVGTTGGAAVPTPYYDPPPVFVHEWTRSVLYLPGPTDTIVVHDRAHVTDVLRKERYYAVDRALFDKTPSAKQWILHMPVRPTIQQSSISWTTPGGQQVRWLPLLPESVKTDYDEKALKKSGDAAWKGGVTDSELRYHVKVWPVTKKDWDTFLNVIQVGDGGAVALVKGSDQAEGVHVARVNQPDVVAMFNAQPSSLLEQAAYHPSHDAALRTAHLRSTGYSVKWTAVASATDLLLADLDPTRRWVVEVDGRVLVPVSSGSSDSVAIRCQRSRGAHADRTAGAGDGAGAGDVPGSNSLQPGAPPTPTGLTIDQMNVSSDRPEQAVLMLCYHFPPVSAAGTQRNVAFARLLPRFGWKPIVLTVRTPRNSFERSGEPPPAGIDVVRSYEWDLHRGLMLATGVLNRACDLLQIQRRPSVFFKWCLPDPQIAWLTTVRGILLNRQHGCIYASCSPFSSALSACVIKKGYAKASGPGFSGRVGAESSRQLQFAAAACHPDVRAVGGAQLRCADTEHSRRRAVVSFEISGTRVKDDVHP